MSKRVIFTCTMLLILGMLGCYDAIASYLNGRVNINAFAFFLPVSIALFLGWPGSRKAATAVFTLNYLLLVFILLAAGTTVPVIGLDSPLMMARSMIALLVIVIFAVLSLLHWMLFSPPFDEHLKPRVRANESEE